MPTGFGGLVYDAGAGVGTAGLGLATRCEAARVGLIERDPLSAALAQDNVLANGLGARVAVHACDLIAETRALEKADFVVTNPPYYEAGTVRSSPDARRRMAHVGLSEGTATWIKACLGLLRAHGALVVIHRTEALPQLLQVLERRAGGVTILPIHTREGAPAKRILLRAVCQSRAPLTLLPGLVLNGADEANAQAVRIARGEAALDW